MMLEAVSEDCSSRRVNNYHERQIWPSDCSGYWVPRVTKGTQVSTSALQKYHLPHTR